MKLRALLALRRRSLSLNGWGAQVLGWLHWLGWLGWLG